MQSYLRALSFKHRIKELEAVVSEFERNRLTEKVADFDNFDNATEEKIQLINRC